MLIMLLRELYRISTKSDNFFDASPHCRSSDSTAVRLNVSNVAFGSRTMLQLLADDYQMYGEMSVVHSIVCVCSGYLATV